MYKLYLVFILLFSFFLFAEEPYYFNYKLNNRCAEWIAYWVDISNIDDNSPRVNQKFIPHPDYPGSPTQEELELDGYDKGHGCTDKDMSASPDKRKKTYYTVNVMLQYYLLNRGSWKALEYQIRKLARSGEKPFVICGPIFYSEPNRNAYDVAIPDACFKVVYSNNKWSAWLFPNNCLARGPPSKFTISINLLECMTDLNFEDIYKECQRNNQL